MLSGARSAWAAAQTWADFERHSGRSRAFWTVRIRQAKGGNDQLVPCDNAMPELARFRRLVGPARSRAPRRTPAIPALRSLCAAVEFDWL